MTLTPHEDLFESEYNVGGNRHSNITADEEQYTNRKISGYSC